jgi:HPt (histidine-containing phosphotransfer) domain-containing protein
MSDTPLIDTATLDDMIEYIGLEALRPVIELFIGESRELSATMTAGAADPARREAVRRAAHSLKSSAGQLGAAALSEATADLERAAESGAPLVDGAALVARLADATGWALTERMKEPG